MNNLYRIDQKISDISKKLDFYARLTPVNQHEQFEAFFEKLKQGKRYEPFFKYVERDITEEKKELKDILGKLNDDPQRIDSLFFKKAEHISRQMDLLKCADEDFGKLSSGLYGLPGKEDLEYSRNILIQTSQQKYEFPKETVSPEEMVDALNRKLRQKSVEGWKVLLSDKIIPKLSVSGRDKTIYVNPGINYTREEIQRLMVHEIEVHVYRALNGARQPFRIFSEGLAGYDETEEGLAVLAEKRAGCFAIDNRQIKLYAGRCFAVKKAFEGSFYHTFSALSEFFPAELAYRLTERVKRGLKDTSKQGGFTKDIHYMSGFNKLTEYMSKNGMIKVLYSGKIGLNDVDIIKNLTEKGILKPPEYLPDHVK